jgi:hypothetical protein
LGGEHDLPGRLGREMEQGEQAVVEAAGLAAMAAKKRP